MPENNSPSNQHLVVISGGIDSTFDYDNVLTSFAKKFRIEEYKAREILDRAPYTIKRCNTEEEANRYLAVLLGLGLNALVESPSENQDDENHPLMAAPNRKKTLLIGIITSIVLLGGAAGVLGWMSEEAKRTSYLAQLTCVVHGTEVDMYICLKEDGIIEIIRNGTTEIIAAPNTRDYSDKKIELPESFSIKVQNMGSYLLNLTIRDLDGVLVFEQNAQPYQVISVVN